MAIHAIVERKMSEARKDLKYLLVGLSHEGLTVNR